MLVTRFAPSPTGLLHLGHAYAALYRLAPARGRRAGGFCCASRTSTPRAAARSSSPPSLEDLRLARPRLGRRGAAPIASISTITARRSTGSRRRGWSIPASAPAPTIRPRSRARSRRKGRRGRSIPAPAASLPPAERRGADGGGRALRAAARCRRRRSRAPGRSRGRTRRRARSRPIRWRSATSCWRARTRRPAIISRSRSTMRCKA